MKPWLLLAALAVLPRLGLTQEAGLPSAPVRPPRTYDLKNVEWHLTLHPESRSIEPLAHESLWMTRDAARAALARLH